MTLLGSGRDAWSAATLGLLGGMPVDDTAVEVEREADVDHLVREITEAVADRLIDALDVDESEAHRRPHDRRALVADERRQHLLIGGWIADELLAVNERRMRTGDQPLEPQVEQLIGERVVAELTGAGPLEPYLADPSVEEIDVNGPGSTWVTYVDGRKVDVGRLWASAADLTAYQKRLALRMRGTGEGRLDTSSPMLTLQGTDGSRIVMVLGGDSEHGISTHPRIAIRRFVVRGVGLAGLADRGLFPHDVVPRLEALVRCGFTILVSGPPGAGKTTLLTELLGAVSPLERIITVEKNLLELRLEDDPRHPDAPALFTRHANAEGEGEVSTSPARRAHPPPQPGPGRRRRARGGRSPRHARRGIDVQARLARDHPRAHRGRRAAPPRGTTCPSPTRTSPSSRSGV